MDIKYIDVKVPTECFGCGACQQVCPVDCITLREDSHGFLFPKVNRATCINCGRCRTSCPILLPNEERIPLRCFGAQRQVTSNTEASTTVGTFYLLAKNIIEQGGIVFGAKYNEDFTSVYHSFTYSLAGLREFQKSKYVQSIIGDSFKDCKSFLDKGIKVLFSGTPCQISGLKKFLNKSYDNLITVDLICHGVPSNKIWKDILTTFILPKIPKNSIIISIDFRDERLGWRDSGLSVQYITIEGKPGDIFTKWSDSIFFGGFYHNIFLRETCYRCPEKLGRSHSDITLGDFRALSKLRDDIDPSKPTGVVLANSTVGIKLVRQLNLKLVESSMPQVLTSNPELYDYNHRPIQEAIFWRRYTSEGILCLPEILESLHETKTQRLVSYIKQIIGLLLNWHKK